MPDQDQKLIEAASQYLATIERDGVISIPDYVATADPAIREELAPYLELVLAAGALETSPVLTAQEQLLAEQATTRMRERWQQRVAAPAAQSLTAVRTARKLSVKTLAQRINLPVDLLARIERGGVAVGSLPAKLVARLATALEQTDAQLRAALELPAALSLQLREGRHSYTPQLSPGGLRLHAQDGTVPQAEAVVSFHDALAASMATAEQRAEWQQE